MVLKNRILKSLHLPPSEQSCVLLQILRENQFLCLFQFPETVSGLLLFNPTRPVSKPHQPNEPNSAILWFRFSCISLFYYKVSCEYSGPTQTPKVQLTVNFSHAYNLNSTYFIISHTVSEITKWTYLWRHYHASIINQKICQECYFLLCFKNTLGAVYVDNPITLHVKHRIP